MDEPNRIYGEGVSTTGERWRNAVYPNLGDKTVPEFPTVAGGPMQLGDHDDDTSTGSGVTVMVRELFGKIGGIPVANSPEEFRAIVRADIAKWRDVVARSGIAMQ